MTISTQWVGEGWVAGCELFVVVLNGNVTQVPRVLEVQAEPAPKSCCRWVGEPETAAEFNW